jgi:hypothetical protein
MKEIGGYFGLECANFSTDWLDNKVALNSGRNALKYILRAYNIKKIAVPSYTCAFVWDSVKNEGCELNFYQIDKNFMPTTEFSKDSFILYNNYFGISNYQVELLKQQYKNLVIDNTQAFYSSQKGLASFYSLRKFFGVPDGGLAWCDKELKEDFETSTSYHSCIHLLKSLDKGYDNGYINFMKNEFAIDDLPIQKMSNLTKVILRNIDYNKVKQIRLNNFNILHKTLEKTNELKINLTNDDIPMVYPYLINNEALRNDLIKNKIYLISCWPDIEKFASDDVLYLKKYLLPLPIDQRYNENDMKRILDVLCKVDLLQNK